MYMYTDNTPFWALYASWDHTPNAVIVIVHKGKQML